MLFLHKRLYLISSMKNHNEVKLSPIFHLFQKILRILCSDPIFLLILTALLRQEEGERKSRNSWYLIPFVTPHIASTQFQWILHVCTLCLCIIFSVCVCVCECVCDREKRGERKRSKTAWICILCVWARVCVCVCVCTCNMLMHFMDAPYAGEKMS